MADNRNTSGGTSTLTVLLIVFVVLKLTDNVDWSWFWVLSPMIIPLGLIAAIGATYLAGIFFLWLLKLPVYLFNWVTGRPKSALDKAYNALQEDDK
jgi:hypothetical protein